MFLPKLLFITLYITTVLFCFVLFSKTLFYSYDFILFWPDMMIVFVHVILDHAIKFKNQCFQIFRVKKIKPLQKIFWPHHWIWLCSFTQHIKVINNKTFLYIKRTEAIFELFVGSCAWVTYIFSSVRVF